MKSKPYGKSESSPKHPSTLPKKRRRGPSTSGAANDCFACLEHQRKCDRKRPYCTQCLDDGKDCSGYKTTLTWNVGVASRGKLRGLSLPIIKSEKTTKGQDCVPKKSSASGRKTDHSSWRCQAQSSPNIQAPNNNSSNTRHYSAEASPEKLQADISWRWILNARRLSAQHCKRAKRQLLKSIQAPAVRVSQGFGDVQTQPNTTTVTTSEHKIGIAPPGSAAEFSCVRHQIGNGQTLDHQADSCPPEYAFEIGYESAGYSGDEAISTLSSDQDNGDCFNREALFADPRTKISSRPLSSTQPESARQPVRTCGTVANARFIDDPGENRYFSKDSKTNTSAIFSNLLPPFLLGKTRSLQILISYYDKVISPVIVAFDGPTNPYRSYILRLAVESEALQHAIAALSASNLRQRRGFKVPVARRRLPDISSSRCQTVKKSWAAYHLLGPGIEQLLQENSGGVVTEELYHKGASIQNLNELLADPGRRNDESILATLLILCLYHICNTGLAKFKTQFTGVKKLLALRNEKVGAIPEAPGWLTIMFTWFDAITASVNNREAEFSADILGLNTTGSDDWLLESLIGCDSELFKIIAKLGRLSILRQRRPAQADPAQIARVGAGAAFIPEKSGVPDYYSMNHVPYDDFVQPVFHVHDQMAGLTDKSDQFWREGKDIRNRLEKWRFRASFASLANAGRLQEDQVDLFHISESFRYSALLYTERLAFPCLPCTHPRFQQLVTSALHHIAQVQSDVFLLWPLFITGSECVSAIGRSLIRERCLSIQRNSGFFNNVLCLKLLEHTWQCHAGDEEGEADGGGNLTLERSTDYQGGHVFRWQTAMEEVDGEYIIL